MTFATPLHNEEIQAYSTFKIIERLLKAGNESSGIQDVWEETNNSLDTEGAVLIISQMNKSLCEHIWDTKSKINEDVFSVVSDLEVRKINTIINFKEIEVDSDISEEVNSFLYSHELSSVCQKAVNLIEKHFSCADKVNVEISVDPEEPEYKKILFRLYFSDLPEIVFEKWTSFLPEYTKTIPYNKRRFLSIELIPQ